MTGRVIRFKSLVKLIGITGWKFQLLFQWPLFSRKLLNWLSMDQTLLTGLLSFRFSSLADSASPAVWRAISSSWVSVTAPKLKFSSLPQGTGSETCPVCEKGSSTELMVESTSDDSVARMPCTAKSRLNARTVIAKWILDRFIYYLVTHEHARYWLACAEFLICAMT